MVNINKLRSYLALRGMTIRDLAEAIKMPISTLSNKINGRTEFTASEMGQIQTVLNIPDEEVLDIFIKEVK
jgi:transcriptional regulator with XRE-family HTH domain